MKALKQSFLNAVSPVNYRQTISATQVATIVGLNNYQTDRELFMQRTKICKYTAKKSFANKSLTNSATAHGIKYENNAIKLFMARHQLDNGFSPPYIANTNDKDHVIGGKGDYIFINKDNKSCLLEIKCVYSRTITHKIPIHYWLQVQIMLYIYDNLNLNIDHAIYCENKFSQDTGKLMQYWEKEIHYNKIYIEQTIIPILKIYSKILTLKRPRDIESQVISKRAKGCNRIVERIQTKNLFHSILMIPKLHDNGCLNNYIINDHLVDWITMYHQPSISIANTCKISKYKLDGSNPIYKLLLKNPSIVNIDNLIVQSSPETDSIEISNNCQNFQFIRIIKTLEAIQKKYDVILNGQLYSPILKTWGHFDMLIRHGALSIDLQYPDNYVVVSKKISCLKKQKMESYVNLSILNYYFSKPSQIGIFTSENSFQVVDFKKLPKYDNLLKSGYEWINQLTINGKNWSINPPSNMYLYPNHKQSHLNPMINQIKNNISIENGELTQLWSISINQRNRLLESDLKISTIDQLGIHINKGIVKNILGHKLPIIKSMIKSNQTKNIVNWKKVKQNLNIQKNSVEVYLDFEFTTQVVYLIGYYINSNNQQNSGQFRQLLIDKSTPSDEIQLFEKFNTEMQNLKLKYGRIMCYHWGQVEPQLITKKCPRINNIVEFVDLCQLLKSNHLGIPKCYSYGLKDVAKALKGMNAIKSIWKNNNNGYWSNKKISQIYKSNGNVLLKNCNGINNIKNYNKTDCMVMFDIVSFFRKKKS